MTRHRSSSFALAAALAAALLTTACGADPEPATSSPPTAAGTTAAPSTVGTVATRAAEPPVASVPTKAQADSLIGRTPEAARASGYVVRAVRIDGVAQMGTTDYRPERINVAVAGGVITEIVGLG